MENQINVWSKTWPHWLWNMAIIAIVLLIGIAVKVVVKLLLNYYKNKKDNSYSFLKSFVTHFSRPLNHFIPLLVINLFLPYLTLKDNYADDVKKWLSILLLISFASLLINAITILEDYIYYKYDFNKEDNLKERKVRTQLQFVRQVATVLIVLITLALILLSFENVRKLGAGLLTGVGIGGIIIGFAAQKSLGNLLAGFQIAFTQPIRIDDVLVVEGEWGRVEDITLTYVVISIWDQRRLILPINYFIEKPFQNWTRTTSQILGTVFIYVDYKIPAEAMRNELLRLLNESPLWDKRVGKLQVTDIKENVVELRILVSAANSSNAFDLRCYIREKMVAFLQEHYPETLPRNRYVLANEPVKNVPNTGSE